MTRYVPLSENGRPVGEHHHRATIPDAIVKQLRDLHEFQGLGEARLARMFSLRQSTVNKIIYYTRRNVIPRDYRKVEDDDK